MEYTRPATWDDVKAVARYFADAGVAYALVGAYAIAAHGFSRFSEDIDVLVDPSAENSRRWIGALSKLPDAAAAELAVEGDVFADDKRYAIRINDLTGNVHLSTRRGRSPRPIAHLALRSSSMQSYGKNSSVGSHRNVTYAS